MADTPETSPLLKADGGTLAFAANAGLLRVRYGGWDEAKVLAPGESLELVARNRQVWAYRRGEPLKGPAPDPRTGDQYMAAGAGLPRVTDDRGRRLHREVKFGPQAGSIAMLYPGLFQQTLEFVFKGHRVGFARELTMPLSDGRITSGAHWCGFPNPG
jgi:hypothetical protein